MARKRKGRWMTRAAGTLVLLGIVAGGAWWWTLRSWMPDAKQYPVQGVEVGPLDGTPDFVALKAIGAQFAYVDATAGAFGSDPSFGRNLEAARAAGLQVGAVHLYDPCEPADRQAARFVTTVPRDAKMLPPAVALDALADSCPLPVSEAAVQSELTTFVNQVEIHTGKPVILQVSPAFEKRYQIAARVDRNLWLVRDRFEPGYAGRPWMLWTANAHLASDAEDAPLRWVVVQR
ncbi:glycoside hydrolase family 25 protein [Parablastomonas sp. CN1-191]|uniref:glycoside hydrolase family 25 protein n=1 Tax=Parablastomonas sp. CN1-191 TaxID=3400908 RepID=UPI003BF919CC